MDSALTVAVQAAIMLILLGVGYGLYKGRLLGDDATKQLSNIALTVIMPIVIFNSYQTEFAPKKLRGLLIALVLSFLAQGLFVAAATIIVRPTNENYQTERFALCY